MWLSKVGFDHLNEHTRKYNSAVDAINKLSPRELYAKLVTGECPYPSEHLKGVPMGQHHCPICGTMVVAGIRHLDLDPPFDPVASVMAKAFVEQFPEVLE